MYRLIVFAVNSYLYLLGYLCTDVASCNLKIFKVDFKYTVYRYFATGYLQNPCGSDLFRYPVNSKIALACNIVLSVFAKIYRSYIGDKAFKIGLWIFSTLHIIFIKMVLHECIGKMKALN